MRVWPITMYFTRVQTTIVCGHKATKCTRFWLPPSKLLLRNLDVLDGYQRRGGRLPCVMNHTQVVTVIDRGCSNTDLWKSYLFSFATPVQYPTTKHRRKPNALPQNQGPTQGRTAVKGPGPKVGPARNTGKEPGRGPTLHTNSGKAPH